MIRWATMVAAILLIGLAGAATMGAAASGVGAAAVDRGAATPALAAAAGSTFVRPVAGAVVTQGFGCTPYVFEAPDPHCPGGHWHSGIDLAVGLGTPVRATLAGRVHVLVTAGGYGIHVIVDHGNGMSSLYGHLSAAVADGTAVAAGGAVGAVGSTGNSTGPHLHFEIRRDGIAEDPRLDLALP